MHQIRTAAELSALTSDPLLLWAAQDLRDGVTVWRHGRAIGVAVTRIAARDRLAVSGPVDEALTLVRSVCTDDGPAYRPIGDAALIEAIVDRSTGWTSTRVFGWCDTSTPPDRDPRVIPFADDAAATALLDVALPESNAWPGMTGIERWWGVLEDGHLRACAAECWSGGGIGYLAAVASAPDARGRGLGRAVVATALHELVVRHGAAALMVEHDARPARGLYASLGMSYRPLRAAVRVRPEYR